MPASPKEVLNDKYKKALDERAMIISRNLKFERFRKSLTQAELAERVGIAERTVRKHEAGKPMDMIMLFAYADALDCTCENLFNERKGSDAQIMKAFEIATKLPKERREEYLDVFGIM